jgi:hypothetical protein
MKTNKLGLAFVLLISTWSLAHAAEYANPDVDVRDRSPAYRPSKGVSYEDSYHITGVADSKTERAIASEDTDREPSSASDETKTTTSPKPWLTKTKSSN